MTRFMRSHIIFVVMLVCQTTWAASEHVSSSDLGAKWPLTAQAGVLNCELIYEYEIVTFTSKGKTYAVNGLARGNRAKKRGWLDVAKIWKSDPQAPELKINIGPLIDRGRSLCWR